METSGPFAFGFTIMGAHPMCKQSTHSKDMTVAALINWQKAEGAVVFLAGLVMYWAFDSTFAWWAAILWFFAPDISFIAYLKGNRIGSYAYNAVHTYGFGAAIFAFGLWFDTSTIATLGALWLAHSGFDRMLGYGLKSESGFKDTHLGPIGRN